MIIRGRPLPSLLLSVPHVQTTLLSSTTYAEETSLLSQMERSALREYSGGQSGTELTEGKPRTILHTVIPA